MTVPINPPGLRLLAVALGVYGFIWLALEGALVRDLPLALGLSLAIALVAVTRLFGGRRLKLAQWLALSAVAGLAAGLLTALLLWLLMAVKTGLHSHGPEYTAAQIVWVGQQAPYWAAAGLLGGLGIGLLLAAVRR